MRFFALAKVARVKKIAEGRVGMYGRVVWVGMYEPRNWFHLQGRGHSLLAPFAAT